uniref:Protein phosphatase methylesterase 1 n=1 Tax=Timema monikensis TaxID=170555 RepID=A0A7R9HNS2_9NEOP|nr:unnamed protein product [Timema monikensis]
MKAVNDGSARRGLSGRKRDYTPVAWSHYFTERQDVKVNDVDSFRVYKAGTTGPLLVLLHGGGFSALTWSLFSVSVTSMVECRVLAIDLRGHGDTITSNEKDLSAKTMSGDVAAVLQKLYDVDPPPIILIGHSMGGAIAVHTACANSVPSLIGLAVIDVVEGTAIDALNSMQSFLRSRPTHFKSLEHAIEWCVRSAQVRNVESAKVSMPGQIKNCETGMLATNDLETYVPSSEDRGRLQLGGSISEEESDTNDNNETETSANNFKPPPAIANFDPVSDPLDHRDIPEAQRIELRISGSVARNSGHETIEAVIGELNQTSLQKPIINHIGRLLDASELNMHKYTWRINLGQTEEHWRGWFTGLSNEFLNCQVPKMLLLAGIDRLDKDLTVGQMQGKFQMQVLPQCGHAVHEDVPEKVAEVVATFLVRHKFTEPAANFESAACDRDEEQGYLGPVPVLPVTETRSKVTLDLFQCCL